MNWVVFSYSLPAKSRSSPRVAVWRRLGRLGAVSTTSGVYVLPARDECIEAFQWLAQETRQANGEALVMRVEQFEGLTDAQLIEQFNRARQTEYREIDAQAAELEKCVRGKGKRTARIAEVHETLNRLRRRCLEVARIDYFDCPEAGRVAARLETIERVLDPIAKPATMAASSTVTEYQDRRWVTRPRPHVDRLACIWLIRRFINPHAEIRYSARPELGEVGFDISGARFGHAGNRCSFETMLHAFGLDGPALRVLAEIVHELDLHDGKYRHPVMEGVDAVLSGWRLANLPDEQLEVHGTALFEGLYHMLSQRDPTVSEHISAAAKQRPKNRARRTK